MDGIGVGMLMLVLISAPEAVAPTPVAWLGTPEIRPVSNAAGIDAVQAAAGDVAQHATTIAYAGAPPIAVWDLRPCELASVRERTCAGPRFWGDVDYLLWWIRRAGAPPLVTTGGPTDAFPGAIDQATTRVLFGNHLSDGTFNGMRLSLGAWLDREQRIGLEAVGFLLERRAAVFSAQGNANGQPFLAAPFVNGITGNPNVYFISQNLPPPAISALLTGGVNVFDPTQLWSWEVNGVANITRSAAGTVNLLAGFRQISLRENLTYTTAAENLAPGGAASFLGIPLAPGLTVATFDQFRTANLFDGGQLGIRVDRRWGRLGVDLTTKVGLGAMHQTVNIAGLTSTNAPFAVREAVGGIYAQASNIGYYSRDVFAVVPEVGANLRFDLTSNLRLRVGYDFLFISSVVRPGDQIDPVLNPNHVPIDGGFGTPGGPNRPTFDMHSTSFWTHGVNVGIELRF
jgi:hypothetical protein